MKEQQLYSELLTLSLLPVTLQRKLILAACVCGHFVHYPMLVPIREGKFPGLYRGRPESPLVSENLQHGAADYIDDTVS